MFLMFYDMPTLNKAYLILSYLTYLDYAQHLLYVHVDVERYAVVVFGLSRKFQEVLKPFPIN